MLEKFNSLYNKIIFQQNQKPLVQVGPGYLQSPSPKKRRNERIGFIQGLTVQNVKLSFGYVDIQTEIQYGYAYSNLYFRQTLYEPAEYPGVTDVFVTRFKFYKDFNNKQNDKLISINDQDGKEYLFSELSDDDKQTVVDSIYDKSQSDQFEEELYVDASNDFKERKKEKEF